MPAGRIFDVTAAKDGTAHIELAGGKTVRVRKEKGQTGITDPSVAEGGAAAGWLVETKLEGVASDPVPLELVIWKDGRIIRRISTGQAFYSWTFDGEKRVAYHTGPLHGEKRAHCELVDIATGRRIATWEGELESGDRPFWAAGLNR